MYMICHTHLFFVFQKLFDARQLAGLRASPRSRDDTDCQLKDVARETYCHGQANRRGKAKRRHLSYDWHPNEQSSKTCDVFIYRPIINAHLSSIYNTVRNTSKKKKKKNSFKDDQSVVGNEVKLKGWCIGRAMIKWPCRLVPRVNRQTFA